MSKNNNGAVSLLKKISTALHIEDLPSYSRFNLLSTVVVSAIVIALSVQPVLALVESLLISLGNIFILLFTTREVTPRNDNSSVLTLLVCFLVILIETIACKIYCFFAQKINNK